MTTRQFDPVLSAALRNELEALADRAEDPAPTRPVLARPQVWVTAVTALVLVLATVGVLRLTAVEGTPPAGGGGSLVDPLVASGGPSEDETLRDTPVTTLLHRESTGPTTFAVDVPAGTTWLGVYATCSPRSAITVADDAQGDLRSTCAFDGAVSSSTADPSTGQRRIDVVVPERTRFRILVLAATPASTTTVSQLEVRDVPAGVSDPLEEIQDPASDSYIRANPEVLVHASGGSDGTFPIVVADDLTSVRPYVNCTPESGYRVEIDGVSTIEGTCDPSFSGSFSDIPLEPGQHTFTVRLTGAESADRAFVALLIATPQYLPSTSGPSRAPLPYPTNLAADQVLARDRGAAGITTGRIPRSVRGVSISITCRGDGAVAVQTPFGTLGNPAGRDACGTDEAVQTGGGVSGRRLVDRPRYTITPYGDVRWTVTFMQQSD
jgi:hypothetical protein